MFILSLCFFSSNAFRLLLVLAYVAVLLVTEVFVGVIYIQTLSIQIELFQESTQVYMFGVLTSNLLTLLIVLSIRIFIKVSKYDSKQSNLLIAFMPLQSIILCYVVVDYIVITEPQNGSPIGVIAVMLSVLLIFITMFILNNQQKAMMYKREYELSKTRLDIQVEHYKDVYQEQQRVKSMRHDMNNYLIALLGALSAGNVEDAIKKINKMSRDVVKISDIIDTGNPPIDAILSVKTTRAMECGIRINHTVIIDGELYIDQFDIAVVIANALDNAIEGVQRSTDVEKVITLNVSRVADYISIIVENYASGPIHEDFQTSKSDKRNHGHGMTQMKDVAEKYKGSFQPSYDEKQKRFSLKIMLQNQQV